MELFAIRCTTCQARLKVRDTAAIGMILACPKCQSMVQVTPPPGWQPPAPGSATQAAPKSASPTTSSSGPTPAPPSLTDSVGSGLTIRIPAHLAAAACASAAAATAAQVSAASASAAEPTVINPSDIPPLPPERPSEHWSQQWIDRARQHWLVLACAPVVAMVCALFLWIILRPGTETSVPPDAVPEVPASQIADSAVAPAAATEEPIAAPAATAAAPQEDDGALGDAATHTAANSDSAIPEEPPVDIAADAPLGIKPDDDPGAEMPDAEPASEAEQETAAADAPRDGVPPLASPAAHDAGATAPGAASPADAIAAGNAPRNGPDDNASPAGDEDTAAEDTESAGPTALDSMPQVDVAARLADPLPGMKFKRIALADACEFLSRLSTIPITLDVDGLAAAGVHPGDLVSISAADSTIGDALLDLIGKGGLVYAVEGQQLIVTAPALRSGELASAKYDVSDLADSPEAVAALAGMVTKFVAPLSWQERGGKARVEAGGKELIIQQSPLAQRQVAAMLDKVRQARGLPAKESITADEAAIKTHYSRAKTNLDKVVTANFGSETPLAEILSWLSRATSVRILVDEASLADAGLWSRAPASVVADRQPLYEVLSALLDPGGMTYRIVDERTIQVFARRSLADRHELEIYPVGNLLARHLAADELIRRLRDRVDPASWSDGGGPGAIALDEPSKSLLVLQSPDVQVRLENLLQKAASGVRPAAENR